MLLLLIACALLVPLVWGYAVYWVLESFWAPVPADSQPELNLPDYQI